MDRNFLLAMVLSIGVLLIWDLYFMPDPPAPIDAPEIAEGEQTPGNPDFEGITGLPTAGEDVTVEEALARSTDRVEIRTPDLVGSINLDGARLDDLRLTQYREEVDDENSPIIRLLSPRATEHGHYAQVGWIADADLGESAKWNAPAGAVLTPETPVTLTRQQGNLVFEKNDLC